MTDELMSSREIHFIPPKGAAGRRRVLECWHCFRQAVVFEANATVTCSGPDRFPHEPTEMVPAVDRKVPLV